MNSLKSWTEAERLAALDSYQILHTSYEEKYDALVRMAADVADAPVSLITLLTEDRQWFKAAVGTDLTGTARAISFCTVAIEQPNIMIVNDATADPRFSNNPLVTEPPHIRFYAGVPLRTPSGLPLGTLCVLDQQPRDFTSEQQSILESLAARVIDLLEERKRLLEAETTIKVA